MEIKYNFQFFSSKTKGHYCSIIRSHSWSKFEETRNFSVDFCQSWRLWKNHVRFIYFVLNFFQFYFYFLKKRLIKSGNDRISLIGLNEFTPGKPLTIKVFIKYKYVSFLKLNCWNLFFKILKTGHSFEWREIFWN